MTDIEKKALALLNECGWGGKALKRTWNPRYEALCRAIEQHETFRQEVSDVVKAFWPTKLPPEQFARFIIAKPDPLVEALKQLNMSYVDAEDFREALAKRGGKIVWGEAR